jgi:AcrR family transcriptional regulator
MTTDHKDTRQKLLEIAGEVFAEEGFRLATVREICKRAHTNIAAINYHFGDKEKLYAEVFRDPRGALAEFIDEMLSRMLNPGKFSWKGTLMAREMVEPSPVLDLIIELWMQPCWDRLKAITALIIDQPIDSEENHIAASSVMAQCFFHKHAGAVLYRLNPTFLYNEAQIKKLAQHLATFAFGGLQALKTL